MTYDGMEAAARFLVAARQEKRLIDGIPKDIRPLTLDAGLAVQKRVAQLMEQDIGGWKCSAPCEPRPINAAPIFASTITRHSPCSIVAVGATARIEPEVAFVMGRDLPKRATPYAEAEIRSAIAESRLVLELLGSRYADPKRVSWPEMIADCVQNQGLFVGPVFPGGLDAPLESFPVRVRTPTGILSTHEGRHGDGHPLHPLYWLVNFLASRDEGLRAGQIVTTGSYAGAISVPMGPLLSIEFGDLGVIEVELVSESFGQEQ